ncbi:MAG: DMT family transporter [Candidatus Heimdallarchaeota archaeon]|nr:MAG: DMT family transporter [Candidatus Heimdallarchaeota archaeon]
MENRSSAYIAVFIAAVLWGTPYTVVKIGLSILSPPLPPLGYLWLRFLIAFLLLFPLFLSTPIRNDIFKLLKNKSIVFLGVINGSTYVLQFLGQVGTTAAIATLLASTYLISTPIFSSYFQGTKITLKLKFAVFGGISGALIVSWSVSSDITALEDTLTFIISTFLVLMSGLVWGGYGVASSEISKKAIEEGIEEMANSPAVFASSNFFSLLMVSILMLILNQSPSVESLKLEAWIAVIYLAVFCTLLPFILYIYAGKVIEATEMNVILLLNIIVGLIIAHIVLAEVLSFFGLLGSFLIISSIYLASSSEGNIT